MEKQRRSIRRRGQGRPRKAHPPVGPETLIAVTRQLMKSKRPSQITRLDIARAAGADPNLVRYYFGDSTTLITAAVVQAGTELKERQAKTYSPDMPPPEKLRRRIVGLLEALYQDPYLHHVIVEEILHGKSKALRDIRDSLVNGTCVELDKILKEGFAAGLFRKVDGRHLFFAMVGACSYAMVERKLFKDIMGGLNPTTVKAYAEFLADALLAGIMARP